MPSPRQLTAADREAIKAIARGLMVQNPDMTNAEAAREAARLYVNQTPPQPQEGTLELPEMQIGAGAPDETTRQQWLQEVRTQENIQEQQETIQDLEARYLTGRRAQLVAQGYPEAEAEAIATREVEQTLQAVPFGYGPASERRESSPVFDLLARRVESLSPELARTFGRTTRAVPGAPVEEQTPQQGVLAPGIAVDWTQESSGLSEWSNQTSIPADIDTFKNSLYAPRLAQLVQEGELGGEEAVFEALKQSYDFLNNLQAKLADTDSYIKDVDENFGTLESWMQENDVNPLVRSFFERTHTQGLGVPNLTPEELQYLTEAYAAKRALRKEELMANPPMTEGVSGVYYDPSGVAPAPMEERPMTEQEIDALIDEEILVPEYVTNMPELRAGANQYGYGILQRETPLGSTRDTYFGSLLDTIGAGGAAVAGVITGGYEQLMGQEEIQQRKDARRERLRQLADDPELDVDSMNPRLAQAIYNVAEGRGGYQDLNEAAQMMGLEEGDFALHASRGLGAAIDVIVPGAEVAAVAGAPLRAAGTAYRTSRQLERAAGTGRTYKPLSDAGQAAVRSGLQELANSVGIRSGFGQRASDVRTTLATGMQDDLAGSAVTGQILETVPDANAQRVLNRLDNEGVANTPYAVAFRQKANELGLQTPAAVVHRELPEVFRTGMYDDAFTTGREVARIGRVDEAGELVEIPKLTHFDDAATTRIAESVRSVMPSARMIPEEEAARAAMELGDLPLRPTPARVIEEMMNMEQGISENALLRGLIGDYSMRYVFDQTKNMPASLDNVVQVSPNTWTSQANRARILQATADTRIGRLGRELAETAPVTMTAKRRRIAGPIEDRFNQPRAIPAFKVTPEQATSLASETTRMFRNRRISRQRAQDISDALKRGVISTEDMRHLDYAARDTIAEGMGFTGAGTVRGSDLARLTPQKQLEVLEPLETRSMSRTLYNKIKARIFDYEPIETKLSVGNRQVLNTAKQEAGALDEQLRSEFSRIRKDPEFRAEYGVREGATNNELLSHLIVGPGFLARQSDVDFIRNQLMQAAGDLFPTKRTKINIWDTLAGTSISRNTSAFKEAAFETLNLDEVARRVAANPNTFLLEVAELAKQLGDIVDAPVPNPRFLTTDPKNINNMFRNAGNRVPEEAQATAYYAAEASRIQQDVVADLLESEIGKGAFDLFEGTKPVFGGDLIQSLDSKEILKSRMKAALEGRTPDYSDEVIDELFGNPDWRPSAPRQVGLFKPTTFATNAERRAAEEVLRRADAIAKNILDRQNLFRFDFSLDDIDKMLDRMFVSQDGYAELAVLFGDDVANQLQKSFMDAYDGLRRDAMMSMEKLYADRHTGQKVFDYLRAFKDAAQNYRYFRTLNVRPRFHFGNIQTGPEIVYQTTGRLVRPSDVVEGGDVISGRNPNRILVKDPTGRAYTAGELRQALMSQTGGSVLTMDLPQVSITDIKNMLKQPETAAQRGWQTVREGRRLVQELPQYEDLAYRYAAMKQVLQEGRTLEEAAMVGRRSMYDTGDFFDIEKGIKKLFLFYGWMRQNFMQSIMNLTSVEGLRRTRKAAAIREDLSRLLAGDEETEYAPAWAATRILLGSKDDPFRAGGNILTGSAPSTILGGVENVVNALSGDFRFLAQGIAPEYKAILDIEDQFARDYNEVPPEHVHIMQQGWQGMMTDDPKESIEAILRFMGCDDPVVPRPARPGEGVDGLVYPLSTPAQQEAYKKFVTAMQMTGWVVGQQEKARAFGQEGTILEGASNAEIASYLMAISPLRSSSPEQQLYWDEVAKSRELQDMIRELSKQEEAATEVGFTEGATPEEVERAERIERGTAIREERLRSLDDLDKAKVRLQTLVRSLRADARAGLLTREEINRRRQEIVDLREEIRRYEQGR